MKASFDFDGTLEHSDVQELAERLILLGHIVEIVTTRWNEENKWRYEFYQNLDEKAQTELHDDLYLVSEELRIPYSFTNMEYKADFLKENNFDIHIDDNWEETMLCKRVGIKGYRIPSAIDRTPIDVEQALKNILEYK